MGKISAIKIPRTDDPGLGVVHWFEHGADYGGYNVLRVDHANDNDADDDDEIDLARGWLVSDHHIDLTIPLRITLDECFGSRGYGDVNSKLRCGIASLLAECGNVGKSGLTSDELLAFFQDDDNFVLGSINYFSVFASVRNDSDILRLINDGIIGALG